MSKQTFAQNPSVFTFQRAMLVTDGAFFNLIDGNFQDQPLMVVRHGIRGTIGVDDGDLSTTAKSGERSASNIQTTETAKTQHNSGGAVVSFGLRMIDLKHALFACSDNEIETINAVRESVMKFIERAKISDGFNEVCRRIARNVANGSWLWRNRVIASDIKIEVLIDNTVVAKFDALSVPMDKFDDFSKEEIKVADILAAGLRGDRQANLEVRATLKFGVKGAVEVFPSQAYIEGKPQGFARPLYKLAHSSIGEEKVDKTAGIRVMGQAGLRDQKISNRLRCIDTWYEGYELTGKPIPVEPNGANLEFMQFFRLNKKVSAFGVLSRLNLIDPSTEEGMFAIAAMIRGGVFNGPSKKAKAEAKKKAAAEAAENAPAEAGVEE